MSHTTHKRLNSLLTAVVVLLAVAILALPYVPHVSYHLAEASETAPYQGTLRTEEGGDPIPSVNRIVIPSATVNIEVKEGSSLDVIGGGGAWRKPLNTTSPLDSGNTIIVAHRFTYRNPDGGFYHLDKVKPGDRLALYWGGVELLYEVSETKVVDETEISVEDNTSSRMLTLYTCTPLLTSDKRIVVVARPVESIQ